MQLPIPKNPLYLNRYKQLLANFKKTTSYQETHHICPKTLGGADTCDNLIKIPSRIHFIAHWMLWKAYETDKLAYAFWAMCHQKKIGQEERYSKINSKTYALLKERRSKLISKSNSDRWKNLQWAKQTSANIKAAKNKPKEKEKQRKRMIAQNNDPEFRQKIIDGRKLKFADAEWYANYKQLQKVKAANRIKPIIVDGIEYPLATSVATKYNISIATVRQRIKSKTAQFSAWSYKSQQYAPPPAAPGM